jgi:sortase A
MAGHRDGLFRPLKNVKVGDEIRFRTTQEEFRYRVIGTSIVAPDDVSVLESTGRASLTLITCYPFHYVGAAPKRFIVHAQREQPLTSP